MNTETFSGEFHEMGHCCSASRLRFACAIFAGSVAGEGIGLRAVLGAVFYADAIGAGGCLAGAPDVWAPVCATGCPIDFASSCCGEICESVPIW
ncbi:MAG: hypothetical protein WAU31_03535, partial [Candidatus Moraniibacteriota bacterium]